MLPLGSQGKDAQPCLTDMCTGVLIEASLHKVHDLPRCDGVHYLVVLHAQAHQLLCRSYRHLVAACEALNSTEKEVLKCRSQRTAMLSCR